MQLTFKCNKETVKFHKDMLQLNNYLKRHTHTLKLTNSHIYKYMILYAYKPISNRKKQTSAADRKHEKNKKFILLDQISVNLFLCL